jgi:hypothetical protein
MSQVFGDFREELVKNEHFLVISFSPTSIPLQQRWRNNGLSADFVADYLGSFFPVSEDDPQTIYRQKELKGAVSYIANELLENAMKYHDETSNNSIQFGIYLLSDAIVLFCHNYISNSQKPQFLKIIDNLTSRDAGELYIEQLEKLAEDEDNRTSGLGLITIMNYYQAKLGWKLETTIDNIDMIKVTTMAQLLI